MILIKNVNYSIGFSLTALQVFGFWYPATFPFKKWVYNLYGFALFMFVLGSYIMAQLVDLYLIWGDIQLMTGDAFLLFTNLAQTVKIVNILSRKERISSIIEENQEVLAGVKGEGGRKVVERCNRETKYLLVLYYILTTVTLIGWSTSAEKNQLPMRAWYPYDTAKSPAFELTYFHQIGGMFLGAFLNVAKDALTWSLIAQVRCRLELINLALRDVHKGIVVHHKFHSLLPEDQDKLASSRLRECIVSHQKTLVAAAELQSCFSEATFGQFSVSMVIICVTAFQMASQARNPVRLISMGTYLLNMIYQVFLYCYQGNQLREESIAIAEGAYETNWPISSTKFRRSLLVLMIRTRRPVQLYAGSFTTLSLQSFMAIVKTSYSFFTVLQQVGEPE